MPLIGSNVTRCASGLDTLPDAVIVQVEVQPGIAPVPLCLVEGAFGAGWANPLGVAADLHAGSAR